LAAYRVAAAPAAKTLAKAAGVLFVVGTVSNASAASPTVSQFDAVRAVRLEELALDGDVRIGQDVHYEGRPYLVVGTAIARAKRSPEE
jgi:hypothetical protein